jgi:hypothetical protein
MGISAIHDMTVLTASGSPGPGPVMRSVIIGSVIGVVLLGWFVLRGYRD